jgi:hypothetical protein
MMDVQLRSQQQQHRFHDRRLFDILFLEIPAFPALHRTGFSFFVYNSNLEIHIPFLV